MYVPVSDTVYLNQVAFNILVIFYSEKITCGDELSLVSEDKSPKDKACPEQALLQNFTNKPISINN